MSAIADKLFMYFQYPFVVNALIVGVLIALCSSMLGVTLVLKRYSFIGDGLSHVAFGAMAVAAVTGFTDDMPIILLVTVSFAILLLRTGQNAKIKGDGSTSILTLTKMQVGMCGVLSAVVIGVFVLFYNKIFAVTFDENFARAAGTPVGTYNLILAVLIAVIIVLAMNLVGSLLISALVIFPALSAMRVFSSFKSVILCSAVFSVVCAFVGIVLSILAGTPVGATVVMIDILAFAVFYGIGSLKNGGL